MNTTKMDKENTTLTEIITIYERMQKGRAADAVFRVSTTIMESSDTNQVVEDTVPLIPSFNVTNETQNQNQNYNQNQNLQTSQAKSSSSTPTSSTPLFGSGSNLNLLGVGGTGSGSNSNLAKYAAYGAMCTGGGVGVGPGLHRALAVTTSVPLALQQQAQAQATMESFPFQATATSPLFMNKILDFNKYKYLYPKKYIFFSSSTNLIQSDTLDGLSADYANLLKSKFYWLNITDPNETDLSILFSSFNVHDLTISDIREGNTEEKIEIFKHYTFISMRLMCDESIKERDQDMDFNILLFKDFVITIHDKQWQSITDILGFVNLLCTNAETVLTPDWVLFSVFIELAQDAQYLVDGLEPEINQIRIGSKSLDQMSDVMRRIFDMEFQIYTISRFLKPKTNILRTLKTKCGKRLSKIVVRLLSDIRDDFKEISHDLETLDHILERSQDTFLALVNIEKSREANEMSNVMQRVSEIALVFLPIQMVGGFLGMNVQVPYQNEDSTFYFWAIIGGSFAIAALMYLMRACLLNGGLSRAGPAAHSGTGRKFKVN